MNFPLWLCSDCYDAEIKKGRELLMVILPPKKGTCDYCRCTDDLWECEEKED